MPSLTADGLVRHLPRMATVTAAVHNDQGRAVVLHPVRPETGPPARRPDLTIGLEGAVVLGILTMTTPTNRQSHLVAGTSARRHRLIHASGATVPHPCLHRVGGHTVLHPDDDRIPDTVPRLERETVLLMDGQIVIQAPPHQKGTGPPLPDAGQSLPSGSRSGAATTIVNTAEEAAIVPRPLTMTPLPRTREEPNVVPPLPLPLLHRVDRNPRRPGSVWQTCHLVGRKQLLRLCKPVGWPC
jgi:hypothetical protein